MPPQQCREAAADVFMCLLFAVIAAVVVVVVLAVQTESVNENVMLLEYRAHVCGVLCCVETRRGGCESTLRGATTPRSTAYGSTPRLSH